MAGHVRRHGMLPASMTATPMYSTRASSMPRPVGRTVHRVQDRPGRAANRADPQSAWWGTQATAGLHHVPGARSRGVIPALQNNAIDAAGSVRSTTWSPPSAPRASRSGARRRRAGTTSLSTAHPDPSSRTARLRLAICKGIDRQAIANVVQHGLTAHPAPLNNHIFMAGQVGYQDNSAPAATTPSRPARARRAGLEAEWSGAGEERQATGRS